MHGLTSLHRWACSIKNHEKANFILDCGFGDISEQIFTGIEHFDGLRRLRYGMKIISAHNYNGVAVAERKWVGSTETESRKGRTPLSVEWHFSKAGNQNAFLKAEVYSLRSRSP